MISNEQLDWCGFEADPTSEIEECLGRLVDDAFMDVASIGGLNQRVQEDDLEEKTRLNMRINDDEAEVGRGEERVDIEIATGKSVTVTADDSL
ncbi:hypothetical protein AHAS_Ahas15G0168000 [Arachis hypogaea]